MGAFLDIEDRIKYDIFLKENFKQHLNLPRNKAKNADVCYLLLFTNKRSLITLGNFSGNGF